MTATRRVHRLTCRRTSARRARSSRSLWQIAGDAARPPATIRSPQLTATPQATAFVLRAASTTALRVTGPAGVIQLRFGYAFARPALVAAAPTWSMPRVRCRRTPGGRATGIGVSDLRFALYLGTRPRPRRVARDQLSDLPEPPITGDSEVTVPFGANIADPRRRPQRNWAERFGRRWWLIAIVGVVVAASRR